MTQVDQIQIKLFKVFKKQSHFYNRNNLLFIKIKSIKSKPEKPCPRPKKTNPTNPIPKKPSKPNKNLPKQSNKANPKKTTICTQRRKNKTIKITKA